MTVAPQHARDLEINANHAQKLNIILEVHKLLISNICVRSLDTGTMEEHDARPAPGDEVSSPRHDEADLPSDLLTVSEVAAMLRVSKMTIYRMVNSGELPAFRVSRSFRIRAASMQKLMSERSS